MDNKLSLRSLVMRRNTIIVLCLILCVGIWVIARNRDSTLSVSTRPVSVPVHEHGPEDAHYDHAAWGEGETTVPKDMWITGFSASLDGIPAENMHNFYVFKKGTADPWCPKNPEAIWAGGTVSGKEPFILQKPYGIFLKKGDVILVRAMFHNPKNGTGEITYEAASLRVQLGYEPVARTDRSKSLRLYLFGPRVCDISYPIFTIPPHADRQVFTADSPLALPDDGAIIGVRAHFHGSYESGVENTLRLVLNGTPIGEFTTSDIQDGANRNPRLLQGKTPIAVKAGDRLDAEAIFSNPSDMPVPEGMAILGVYFSPTQ